MATGKKKVSRKLIDELAAPQKEAKLPRQRDIAVLFIGEIGGVEETVRCLVEDYRASPPGSPQRMRILEYVFGAFANETRTPVEDMSDAEIEAAIGDMVVELDDGTEAP